MNDPFYIDHRTLQDLMRTSLGRVKGNNRKNYPELININPMQLLKTKRFPNISTEPEQQHGL
jgi:hypothetical protein